MIKKVKGYDESDPISIKDYGKQLIGKTFAEVCDEDEYSVTIDDEEFEYKENHENKNRKGGLGELIEERWFHYKANSDSRADFDKAGVELKVSPYKVNKNKSLSAKERLILTMIDYENVVQESFEDSHFWKKSRLILLIYYLYDAEIKNRLDYKIDYVDLFTPPEEDLKIIKHDFETIVNKIKAGKAHELSESDTLYLGAATKSASSKNRRTQPFSDIPAKPRAFSYKSSYMTHVLNNYIIPGEKTYESILHDAAYTDDFETYVINKLERYKGYTEHELCDEFDIDVRKQKKNLGAMLAYRILGIKGNNAEEFVKANIVVKTIRIEKTGKIRENMSFPNFKFKELIKEEWDDCVFGNYLRETRFLFVVYRYGDDDLLRLSGAQFWNIPYEDLEGNVRAVWEETRNVIKNGVKITEVDGKRYNNFPKQADNEIAHVRPHGKNAMDTYELPDGRQYTKQCFWLNNSYILSQLDKRFF